MFLQKAIALRADDVELLVRAASMMKSWGRRVAAVDCLRAFAESGKRNDRVEDLLSELTGET